jgi:prepilin-type processing-associated H-X9-DG protein
MTREARESGTHLGWASSAYSGSSGGRPGVLAAAVLPINELNASGSTSDLIVDVLAWYTRLFGSFHAGGCHFAMCDGSAHFVSENIDLQVYRNRAQRADGSATDSL